MSGASDEGEESPRGGCWFGLEGLESKLELGESATTSRELEKELVQVSSLPVRDGVVTTSAVTADMIIDFISSRYLRRKYCRVLSA